MTSIFAQHGMISERTREAYRRYGVSPRSVDERLHFYLCYLEEVVPFGITVRHIPTDRSNLPRHIRHATSTSREEIQLLTYGGKIFMSGLVSMDRTVTTLENIAGDEAYTKWYDGHFVSDRDNWRFFTGNTSLRFFKSHHGDEWDIKGTFNPMSHVQQVAESLQREFDRLENY